MAQRTAMRRRPFSVASVASMLCCGLFAVGVVGCGGDPRSVAGFCKRLREQGAALTDPADPAGLAALYADLDAHAPLQIKDAWHEVALLVARATTFDPKDADDTQAFIAESLRAKRSIDTIAQWADVKCKVPLGSVVSSDDTLPDQTPNTNETPGTTDPVGDVSNVSTSP